MSINCLEVVTSVADEASGVTATVVGLCRALGLAGYQVHLLTVDAAAVPPSPGFRHEPHPRATFLRAASRSPSMAAGVRKAAVDCSVVHMHGMWLLPNVYAGHAAAAARRPLVFSPHGCLNPEALEISRWRKRLFWRMLQGPALKGMGLVHASSKMEYEAVRAFGIKAPVLVLPFGIDLPPPASGTLPRDRIVLYLGRLHPIKGLDLLLEAWANLKQSGFGEWRLRIIGPEGAPGYRRALNDMIDSRRIPAVEFGGSVFGEAKWHEYRNAAVTVLPSRSENFGMTVAESLAAGTPVITTDRTPWEALPQRGIGWQVPLRVGALADALRQALSLDYLTREAMGASASSWVAESFSWPLFASKLGAAYHWVRCGGARPPDLVMD